MLTPDSPDIDMDIAQRTDPLRAYTSWITRTALPAWSTLGYDAAGERFRERLDWTGAPIDLPHRCMVQARQIYVYSQACRLGWFDAGGALAERAMASLLRDYCEESAIEASFAFSIDAEGRVVSDVRDAYAHAFVLFALGSLYRLNADPHLLTIAEKTNAFIKARLFDGVNDGVFDVLPLTSREKRQNPLMHLLEAYLSLERAAPGRGYLEDAGRLIALFKTRLFNADAHVLLEYFAEDWSAHSDPAKAQVVEPGHHFEWVWLLGEYEALSGESLEQWSQELYDVALRYGIAPDGLVHDELSTHKIVLKSSHRVWPHTEAIKAAGARHAAGNKDAQQLAGSMAQGLLDHFLDKSFPGGWADHIDVAHAPLVDYVPASSLYHLFFAATEAAVCFDADPRAAAPHPARAT